MPTEELQHLVVFIDSSIIFYFILLSSTSEIKILLVFKKKKISESQIFECERYIIFPLNGNFSIDNKVTKTNREKVSSCLVTVPTAQFRCLALSLSF